MYHRLTALALSGAAVLVGQPALASKNCADRDTVIQRLEANYAEQLTAGGLQSTRPRETVIEVWSSPETGTFTILMTNPSGTSCIVAAGTDFFADPVLFQPASQQG